MSSVIRSGPHRWSTRMKDHGRLRPTDTEVAATDNGAR
jgi:hypothetical protein